MRVAIVGLAAFLCLQPRAIWAGVEGRWSAEIQPRTRGGVGKITAVTLDLSTYSGRITGFVIHPSGRQVPIQEGVLDGFRFSFVTVEKSPKGPAIFRWSGTVDGSRLRGLRYHDGTRQRADFVARRM
jgi:hypothetical protein